MVDLFVGTRKNAGNPWHQSSTASLLEYYAPHIFPAFPIANAKHKRVSVSVCVALHNVLNMIINAAL